MSRGTGENLVAGAVGFAIAAILCGAAGMLVERGINRKWQLEAVRNGAATMTVDPETGRTVFQWNEQGEKE